MRFIFICMCERVFGLLSGDSRSPALSIVSWIVQVHPEPATTLVCFRLLKRTILPNQLKWFPFPIEYTYYRAFYIPPEERINIECACQWSLISLFVLNRAWTNHKIEVPSSTSGILIGNREEVFSCDATDRANHHFGFASASDRIVEYPNTVYLSNCTVTSRRLGCCIVGIKLTTSQTNHTDKNRCKQLEIYSLRNNIGSLLQTTFNPKSTTEEKRPSSKKKSGLYLLKLLRAHHFNSVHACWYV